MNLSILQQLAGQIAVVPYGGFIVSIVMPQYATLIPVIYLALSLVCTMVVSFLLSRFGRKPLLQIGTLITIVSLALITAGFFLDSDAGNIIVIVGIFVWMIATGLAMNPIIWLYIAEIIQPTFITFPTMTNWLFAVLIGILFPILEDAITAGPVFAFFVGYCVLSLILNQKLLVETKDRTETQIYTGYDQIF